MIAVVVVVVEVGEREREGEGEEGRGGEAGEEDQTRSTGRAGRDAWHMMTKPDLLLISQSRVLRHTEYHGSPINGLGEGRDGPGLCVCRVADVSSCLATAAARLGRIVLLCVSVLRTRYSI